MDGINFNGYKDDERYSFRITSWLRLTDEKNDENQFQNLNNVASTSKHCFGTLANGNLSVRNFPTVCFPY